MTMTTTMMSSGIILTLLMILLATVVTTGMILPQEQEQGASSSSSSSLTRVRRDTSRKVYTQIMTCVRNKLGSTDMKEARCVVREMLRVFQVKETVKCKNCDAYFYCMANLNARNECGDHGHAVLASEAVSECEEGMDESLTLAASFGRNNGNCGHEYLCSSGCKFASSNTTCTLTCR